MLKYFYCRFYIVNNALKYNEREVSYLLIRRAIVEEILEGYKLLYIDYHHNIYVCTDNSECGARKRKTVLYPIGY
jgi:hypothetical protein